MLLSAVMVGEEECEDEWADRSRQPRPVRSVVRPRDHYALLDARLDVIIAHGRTKCNTDHSEAVGIYFIIGAQ